MPVFRVVTLHTLQILLLIYFLTRHDLLAEETPPTTGIVVEAVTAGTALEAAGIQVGDTFVSWERVPGPTSDLELSSGRIESVFDWMWLEVEQAPRGTVRLSGKRSKNNITLALTSEGWEAKVRPTMSDDVLREFTLGQAFLKVNNNELALKSLEMAAAKAATSNALTSCWLYSELGKAFARVRRFDNAYAAYQSGLRYAKDSNSQSMIWEAIGDLYETQNLLAEGEQAYKKAFGLRKDTGDESLSAARTQAILGKLAWRQGRSKVAEEFWNAALRTRERLAPYSLALTSSLNDLGNAAWSRGNLSVATEYHERSLRLREKLAPNSLQLADSLNNLGNVAWSRGELNKAGEYYQRALAIRNRLAPDSLAVAFNLNNLGSLAFSRDDFISAADNFSRAIAITEKLAPESPTTASILSNLGAAEFILGNLARAEEYQRRAISLQQKLSPDSLAVATALTNLGVVARYRGDLELASDYYKKALEIQKSLAPKSLDLAHTLHNLGITASLQGDFILALRYYKESLKIREKDSPASPTVADTYNSIGVALQEVGRPGEAESHFRQALAIREKLSPNGLSSATILNNLGALAFEQHKLKLAESQFLLALDIETSISPDTPAIVHALHNLGTVHQRKGNALTAGYYFLSSIEALERQVLNLGGSQEAQTRFQSLHAHYYRDAIEALLAQHRIEEAFNLLERSRARVLLNMIAQRDLVFTKDIPEDLDGKRRRYAADYDRLQRRMAELRAKDSREIAECLSDLRSLKERYEEEVVSKIAALSPRLRSLQFPQPLDLKSIRGILDPGTSLLYYSVGEKATNVFEVSASGSLKMKEVAIGSKELRSEVQLFEELLQSTSARGNRSPHSRGFESLARRLYSGLVEPVAEALERSQRILIIPDGPLHALSWGALIRGPSGYTSNVEKDWLYLAEWKPLHISLSATIYAELRQEARRRDSSITLAAFGDALFPQGLKEWKGEVIQDTILRSAAERGVSFAPLPASRNEVERIISLFPEGNRSFLGIEASEENAKSLPRHTRIVHFATHATLDEHFPLNSAVVLSIPERFDEGKDNGLLQAWEILEKVRIDADLVVLSACESGLGKEMGGEGLIGLTRAFQYAGARSVMASLWKISDRTTAELMVRFYKHLKEGKPKDEALRAAQMELIHGPIQVKNEKGETETIDASAPYYWAAFQIYGDWQ